MMPPAQSPAVQLAALVHSHKAVRRAVPRLDISAHGLDWFFRRDGRALSACVRRDRINEARDQ